MILEFALSTYTEKLFAGPTSEELVQFIQTRSNTNSYTESSISVLLPLFSWMYFRYSYSGYKSPGRVI
jgi:hypothetical protein